MHFPYSHDIYAGVLGKIIGVYLGRPVEGWAYEKIIEEFGEVAYYVHEACGVPLIVADDDISGTFGFFRTLEDNGYDPAITAKAIGDTWLNYLVEDKTILWWGGLGRSTEHTAYLNLKNGIPAPQSGSIRQNGQTLAEQIGAQIFIDAFAMACPNDPDKAVDLTRKAASVSHDGLAVDAACYLAAMEAMAFTEKRLDKLMEEGLRYITDTRLLTLIEDVKRACVGENDWRRARAKLDEKYGYHICPGCCHMMPNHAMVLASLILGGDDFHKSIKIASSAAWDTDCNAGNVGALNGIRLGLAGIGAGADFRTPVGDQMLVVTAEGGATVSDAVLESRKIILAAGALSGQTVEVPKERFAFELPGSVQGFAPCPFSSGHNAASAVFNANNSGEQNGLVIACASVADGVVAEVSTPTFIDFAKLARNFSTVASPTLYATQTIRARLLFQGEEEVSAAPYVLYYDLDNNICRHSGPAQVLSQGHSDISWTVPDTGGMPIFRVGFSLSSPKHFSGQVVLQSLDWKGAPAHFEQKGMLMKSIWGTNPFWTQTWVSSAKQFAADFKYTYCVSHIEDGGLVTVGTRDWRDYAVSSGLCFALHKRSGLVLCAGGHRRYYAAQFKASGENLALYIDGRQVLQAQDDTYNCGGAGFIIDSGTMTADGFCVEAI